MLSITIRVRDNASKPLRELDQRLADPVHREAIGRAVATLFLDHFTMLDATRPNRLGGRRTHFYADAARATRHELLPNGVRVAVSKLGIAQRYHGGDITPIPPKKYLTIPARAEAHGKRAGEFDDLEVLFGRNGPYALAQRRQTGLRWRRRTRRDKAGVTTTTRSVAPGADTGGGIFFWLVQRVSQPPDESVLPSVDAILNTALDAARAHAAALVTRSP